MIRKIHLVLFALLVVVCSSCEEKYEKLVNDAVKKQQKEGGIILNKVKDGENSYITFLKDNSVYRDFLGTSARPHILGTFSSATANMYEVVVQENGVGRLESGQKVPQIQEREILRSDIPQGIVLSKCTIISDLDNMSSKSFLYDAGKGDKYLILTDNYEKYRVYNIGNGIVENGIATFTTTVNLCDGLYYKEVVQADTVLFDLRVSYKFDDASWNTKLEALNCPSNFDSVLTVYPEVHARIEAEKKEKREAELKKCLDELKKVYSRKAYRVEDSWIDDHCSSKVREAISSGDYYELCRFEGFRANEKITTKLISVESDPNTEARYRVTFSVPKYNTKRVVVLDADYDQSGKLVLTNLNIVIDSEAENEAIRKIKYDKNNIMKRAHEAGYLSNNVLKVERALQGERITVSCYVTDVLKKDDGTYRVRTSYDNITLYTKDESFAMIDYPNRVYFEGQVNAETSSFSNGIIFKDCELLLYQK